jgi:hypothetical protein
VGEGALIGAVSLFDASSFVMAVPGLDPGIDPAIYENTAVSS